MEPSPLTQQSRPDAFEPKVVQLYRGIFNLEDDVALSEGFWRELFLLPPDKKRLIGVLDPCNADDLIHIQQNTKAFVRRATIEAGWGVAPQNENALESLTAFFSVVLPKRYTNPSTDVIDVLAGLDGIDRLMSDLVNGLDMIIRQAQHLPFRRKAIKTALALVAGGYQTTLVSYFTHRDLFPGLVKYLNEVDEDDGECFVLLGLLANFNKFEIQNLYQNRLDDFLQEGTMQKVTRNAGVVFLRVRDAYVAVQNDLPETWTESTLALVGLRSLSSSKNSAPSKDELKEMFARLPTPEAAIILPSYSFVYANKLFAAALVTVAAKTGTETPFAAFLSTSSYMAHNAHRSQRTSHYTLLNLLTIRMLVEDSVLIKRLCSSELQLPVRLCRQRPPQLPSVSGSRIPSLIILDICTDAISHNLRRRLDTALYSQTLGIILRLIVHLSHNKTRLHHHWTYTWGSLLSLIRFLTQYATSFAPLPYIRDEVCTPLISLIAFSLANADSFLPDPIAYDDLFYKIVEAGEVLHKFRDSYCKPGVDRLNRATTALLSASTHYHALLSESKGKRHQSPAAVQKVIRDGYESLDMGVMAEHDDFGQFEPWREGSAKAEIKKIVRGVVEDAKRLAQR